MEPKPVMLIVGVPRTPEPVSRPYSPFTSGNELVL